METAFPIEINALFGILRTLKERDGNLRVFGADAHKYELAPPLSEDEIRAFEREQRIDLPADYRLFLSKAGNGGAGPYYGLESLAESARDRDLSRPFPLTRSTKHYSNEELRQWGFRHEYPGILALCDQGCVIYSYLVVNGPAYGTIWSGREDFYPTGLTFGAWYHRWLNMLVEKALPVLARERLVDRVKPGMTKSEVVAICGGPWREREFAGMTFLHCDRFATEFELDEDGTVVRIVPHSILLVPTSLDVISGSGPAETNHDASAKGIPKD